MATSASKGMAAAMHDNSSMAAAMIVVEAMVAAMGDSGSEV